jgi:hypothetical protein
VGFHAVRASAVLLAFQAYGASAPCGAGCSLKPGGQSLPLCHATRFARGLLSRRLRVPVASHAARVARGSLCRCFGHRASATVALCGRHLSRIGRGSCRLTIRPSRHRFAARLNSGVRPQQMRAEI